MKPLLLIGACLFCTTAMAESPPEQPKTKAIEIPLDEIWAYEMPGTRPMNVGRRHGPLDYISEEGRIVDDIRRALRRQMSKGSMAPPCFAVAGTGLEALHEARAVLVENKTPRESFPAGNEVSLVFFSYSFGRYVHLSQVEHRDNVVEIRYRFVPHQTKEMTQHLALIPLGRLPEGKIRVEVVQLPMAEKDVAAGYRPVEAKWRGRIACGSCSFSIGESD